MDSKEIERIVNEVVDGFGVSDSWEFANCVSQCLDRLDIEDLNPNTSLSDLAFELVDTEMIYTDDQWDLLRSWNNDPFEADMSAAFQDLTLAVEEVLKQMYDRKLEEKNEELNNLLKEIREGIIDLHNRTMQLQDDLSTIKLDDFYDEITFDIDFDTIEADLDDIEAFLSDYDVFLNCEETSEDTDDFDTDDLLADEEEDD